MQAVLLCLLVCRVVAQADGPTGSDMIARRDAAGQVVLAAAGRPVLRYAARTESPPAGFLEQLAPGNRRYARPRSGYIHPLYGPGGESLTRDWSPDHPHHRGIYWAWPEVRWGERQGDLHALQVVFSRPVGEPRLETGPGYARVRARNLWLWQDESPVVFERVAITAHAAAPDGSRAVDLELEFQALVPDITLARRNTDLYGGLNIRLAPVRDLELAHHADPPGAGPPRAAWSRATGTWAGSDRTTTLAVIEHPDNPGFPGDWITYPELPWFQPAFPPAGTRFSLEPGKPLRLRYRLLVLPGRPADDLLAAACATFAATPNVLEPLPTQEDE